VTIRELHPVGRTYLDLATRLLQDARITDAEDGIWEAADVQWWWRVDRHPDPESQSFWLDDGMAVVASVFTKWNGWLGCDLLGTSAAIEANSDVLWRHVESRFRDRDVSMMIRDGDEERARAAERHGFVATQDVTMIAWMDVGQRPKPSELRPGTRIQSYAGGRHPVGRRSGPEVARRLAECSLYRSDLDLAILDSDEVVGYALFWADPLTRVGLLEPMRIEESHQGRGLSKALIAEGLDRLAAAGCTRLKVMFDPSNEPARRLYIGAGYVPKATARTWTRSPGT
jgi:GNAT superfamily N-acetyltransferase